MKKRFIVQVAATAAITLMCSQAAFAANEPKASEYTVPSVSVSNDEIDAKPSAGGAEEYTVPDADSDKVPAAADAKDTETDNNTAAKDADTKDTDNKDTAEQPQGGVKSNAITVSLSMVPRMKVTDSVAVLELCAADGTKLAEAEEWVGGITTNLEYKFNIPEYTVGQSFILRLKSGLEYLKYYDGTYGVGDDIKLQTYGYRDEAGAARVANSFSLDAGPLYEHAVVIYSEGNILSLSPDARLINGVTMVPVKAVGNAMGLIVRYDAAYNSVVCEIGDSQAIFNIGMAYATILGEDVYLPETCVEIDDTAFVPVRTLAEAFGSTVEAFEFGDHIDVCLSEATVVTEFMNRTPVNRWGISSRTAYLVWVDKSNYRVHVYTGSKNRWIEQKCFPCALGAPGTPTITGSFEYQYKASRWEYSGYYVGPCLVFHGGYALHSTLLRYDGTPYDNRVEVQISHGCIRLHKPDIDWLASYLPVGSRIYITE